MVIGHAITFFALCIYISAEGLPECQPEEAESQGSFSKRIFGLFCPYLRSFSIIFNIISHSLVFFILFDWLYAVST
jgi:hypothetical protein